MNIIIKYVLIFSATFILLLGGVCLFSLVEGIGNIPSILIIYSEHSKTFSGGHNIKLMNIKSKDQLDFKISTATYGDFDLMKSDCIAWIGAKTLLIYNPFTGILDKKKYRV